MEKSHFQKVIMRKWLFHNDFLLIMRKSFSLWGNGNDFRPPPWTHFHHRNDFSANGNGNPMAETHFHSLKVISIGPKFIFMQPKLIFITEMEMTFAGGNSFSFPWWKWLSCAEFIFIMEMEMTFGRDGRKSFPKSHFLELARKNHFISITQWKISFTWWK